MAFPSNRQSYFNRSTTPRSIVGYTGIKNMIPGVLQPLRRSNSDPAIRFSTGTYIPNACITTRQETSRLDLSMGPVTMAVVLYVGERLLGRMVSGQLLRKGVARKIRRLVYMITDVHVLQEVFQDLLEDIP